MKKNWFYLFLLMALAVMPLTSCDNNDEPKAEEEDLHDPESDEDQTTIAAYDALEWLQGSLVVVDENNEVVRRIYGEPLDASMPSVISVPVSDFAMAEKLFQSWVAPDKEAIQVEGGYDYALTDAEGKAQGSVSFRAVEGESGVIARMNVSAGTALKQVSEVNFIDYDLWPENTVAKYVAGKTYQFSVPVFDWFDELLKKVRFKKYNRIVEFYCLQGNTDGKEAILVWLCDDYSDTYLHPVPKYYIDDKAYQYLPSVAEAQRFIEFYNENNEAWNKMLDEKTNWKPKYLTPGSTGNCEFLLNSYDAATNKIKCMDLDKSVGEICNVSGSSWFKYRYMYIRVFPPVKE